MSKAIPANPQQLSPRTAEWIEQAKAIVAYPDDYGMTRQEVRGLALLTAAIQGPSTLNGSRARTQHAA